MTGRGISDSESDSSGDDSWIADEDGSIPDKEDDTEVVMKGFSPIDNAEQYAEVSDLSNNLSSMYLRNSGKSGGGGGEAIQYYEGSHVHDLRLHAG